MNGLQFGEYTLDPVLRQLRRGATPIPLPGKAFDLLAYMATNPGRPLPKSELLNAVWPDSFVEESNLSQNVFLLRKALGSDGPIITLPGRGYQFAAQVVELVAPDAPAQSLANTSAAVSFASPETQFAATHSRLIYEERTEDRIDLWRSPLALGAVLVGTAAIVTAAWLGWQRYEDRVGGPPVQVVLADTDGGTGDPVLDRTLKDVLRIELAQSPFVTVVPGATVRQRMTQMMHKADDPVPASVAREICERTGSQAVVQAGIAHTGSSFLVTEQAINCTDGTTLGAVRDTVAHPEALPRAIEKLASALRHDLGESRRTIARFKAPLSPATTSSLEALEDFSQAVEISSHGRYAEAIELLKQAVQLDPNFAAAYLNLSSFSDNTLNPVDAKRYLAKAYDLRQYATEPMRLLITARYNGVVTGDLYESKRNYEAWIGAYPRQVLPWSGLTNIYRELGQAAQGIPAAQRTLELASPQGVTYQALADLQIRVGDFNAAKATLASGFSHGFDTENMRYLLLRLGYLLHDPALIQQQQDWVQTHPDSPILLANMADFAMAHGQFHLAESLYDQMQQAFVHSGAPEAGPRLHQSTAYTYFELGETDRGRKLLHSSPLLPELDTLLALGMAGEQPAAEAMLRKQLADNPSNTAWHQFYQPVIQARFALLADKPNDAFTELERAHPFDFRSADCMYLRARALYQAGQFPAAQAEFQRLLNHPGIEPTAFQLPLAQLYLARTLMKQGKTAEARAAYTAFLELWKDADQDSALLQQVKAELPAA